MPVVTLKDIANLVGVSVNTVSRGLKDKPDIGLKTRQRIKEAAAALGYRPMDNPVRMEFCEKLRVRAERDGYRLLTTSLAQNDEQEWSTGNTGSIEDLLARRVDGLIIGTIWGLTGEQPLGPLLKECRQTETYSARRRRNLPTASKSIFSTAVIV